jgi:hypothetical protein
MAVLPTPLPFGPHLEGVAAQDAVHLREGPLGQDREGDAAIPFRQSDREESRASLAIVSMVVGCDSDKQALKEHLNASGYCSHGEVARFGKGTEETAPAMGAWEGG